VGGRRADVRVMGWLALAFLAALMGLSSPTAAHAQGQPAELEQIVVTGSRIARQDFESASPIVTITVLACGHAAAQYSRDQAIAQAGIPKYADAAKEAGPATASLESRRASDEQCEQLRPGFIARTQAKPLASSAEGLRCLLVSAWPRSASLC